MTAPSPLNFFKRHSLWLALLLAAALIHSATLHYGTNVDEGVYWVEGREIAEGRVLYRDVQFNKPPLITLGGAFFFWFGETPIYPMRYGMVLISLVGLCGLYCLGKELDGQTAGLFAVAFYTFEPFSAVWAKYLHTSTWHPWLTAWVLYWLISGLKRQSIRRIYLSGLVLGHYALCKQTAIYMLPLGLLAWILFTSQHTWRRLLKQGGIWTAGILTLFAPFVIWVIAAAGITNVIYDIWTAHHLIAGWFVQHTAAFRWNEFLSIARLAPVFWLLPLGGLALIFGKRYRAALMLWAWLLVEVLANTVLISHVWRHYFMAMMAPAALLGGVSLAAGLARLSQWSKLDAKQSHVHIPLVGTLLIAFTAVPFWPRADWQYPGITLRQEQALARQVARKCESPYVLNLTNPALYVWADKQIPPVYQGERTTRIPYFMTLVGRGYSTLGDIQRSVERWQTMDLGCVVMYDKYLAQISQNPVLQPLEDWLQEAFYSPQRFGTGDTYYGWVLLFERKDKASK